MCACAVFFGTQSRDLHCRDVVYPPCWIHKGTSITGLLGLLYLGRENSFGRRFNMSATEYNYLLLAISRKLDELIALDDLLFMCRGKLASGSEGNIHDTLSLCKELEENNNLGIDHLQFMKRLLRGLEDWALLGKVEKFECKRKEFKVLLEKVISSLDALNDLERLIAICRGSVREESEGNIEDVRSLFRELENQDNLEFDHLDVVKNILVETESNELLKELEEFEERRNREDKSEARKGISISVFCF